MLIRLTRYCVFQDAGIERPMYAGEAHDLPDGIAESLIATGRAVRVAHLAVPEAKPMAPPERKRVRARA
jgi:hypothetical protein